MKMSSELDEESLMLAYRGRTDLQNAIRNAATTGPHYVELFNYISAHILTLSAAPSLGEQISKKRKLDKDNEYQLIDSENRILLKVNEISFILPQRKKFSLYFTEQYLFARLNEQPIPGTLLAWKEIEYIFLVPIPEKSQKQHGLLFFPAKSCIPPKKLGPGKNAPEPVVITFPLASTPKPESISGSLSHAASAVSDTFTSLLTWIITSQLTAAGNSINITRTDEKLFASAQKQPHLPNEKAVWVKAFRGSKDGHLFFLSNGILWAFRKPFLFMPHKLISAISFTSVLSRTFNLSVDLLPESDESSQDEEIEFCMLDQEDFENINSYVKRYGLSDRSMAEQRKAKMLNINTVKDEAGKIIGNIEASELTLANMSMSVAGEQGIDEADYNDDDEEDEEDYDPGSAGESEGSGSSSEDEAGQDGDLGTDTDNEENNSL